jgi:hypothetical protein
MIPGWNFKRSSIKFGQFSSGVELERDGYPVLQTDA